MYVQKSWGWACKTISKVWRWSHWHVNHTLSARNNLHVQASAAFAEALAAIAAPAGPGAPLPPATSLGQPDALAYANGGHAARGTRIADALPSRPHTPPSTSLSFMQVRQHASQEPVPSEREERGALA